MGINLSKGEGINLAKSDGSTLGHVRMGLGWDAKTVETKGLFGKSKSKQKNIDLDASAVLCGGGQIQENVFYGSLNSSNKAVQHAGDNLTGEGDGDDEVISVDLRSLPATVDAIVFTVNSYSGDRFDNIANAYVRVVDAESGGTELARYTLTGSGQNTAMVMAKIVRDGAGWRFTALGEAADGRTVKNISREVLAAL